MRFLFSLFILFVTCAHAQSYKPNMMLGFQTDFFIKQDLANTVYQYNSYVQTDYFIKKEFLMGIGAKLSIDQPVFVSFNKKHNLGVRGGIAMEGVFDKGGLAYEMLFLTDANLYYRNFTPQSTEGFVIQLGAEYNFFNIYFPDYWMPYLEYEQMVSSQLSVALKLGLANKKLRYMNLSHGGIKPSQRVYSFGVSAKYYFIKRGDGSF